MERSAFDDYDLEEGYITEEELFNKNKDRYTDMLFYIYRNMTDNYTSFDVCEETDVLGYIDYLIFCIDNPRENNEEVSE